MKKTIHTYIHYTCMHAYIHTYRHTDIHTYNSSALVNLKDDVLKFMKVVNNTYEAIFNRVWTIIYIYIILYILYIVPMADNKLDMRIC